LLLGVTGSGKTEVYIRAIQRAIELGKSAIVLLPHFFPPIENSVRLGNQTEGMRFPGAHYTSNKLQCED
jgi:primosomal protein N' (replication factor Y)